MSLRRLMTGVLAAVVVALPAVPAQAAAPAMMSEPSIRAAMLTLPEIAKIAGVRSPMSSTGLQCHYAPYVGGDVRYCYYEQLRSPGAYKAGALSPTHVDVLTFDKVSESRLYLKEMTSAGGADAVTLAKTPTSVTRWNPKADVPVGIDASGAPVTRVGAEVSVYVMSGLNFVYATCANPNGSTAGLQSCANSLVKAQLAKLSGKAGR